jgi:eukaryotic-like serine/threonine-protein kinase
MYYYGRDKRRRLRRRLKQGSIALAVIGIMTIFYFSFFSTQEIPHNVTTAETVKDRTSLANAVLPDTVQMAEKDVSILKDTSIYTTSSSVDEKHVLAQTDEKSKAVTSAVNKKAGENLGNEGYSKPAYEVVSVAHFYNSPNKHSRRNDVINYWNASYASIKPLEERNGFVYVVFKYPLGKTAKGWLRKKDLKKVNTSLGDNK